MKNICVFCAASTMVDERFYELARKMGRVIAEAGCGLVFGGGSDGLMGELARGVHDAGGCVTGVSPEMFDKIDGVLYDKMDHKVITPDMRTRKAKMEELSDAFLALPGGIGTLDEIIELLDLKQLCLHEKPIVLLNYEGYFDPIREFINHAIEWNFAKKATLDLCEFVPTPEAAIHYLKNYVPPSSDVNHYRYFGGKNK